MSLEEEINRRKEEYMKLEKEELAKRLAFYDLALERIPPLVRQCIENMFGIFRGYYRDRTCVEGILLGLDLEIKNFLVYRITDSKDYQTGKINHEEAIKWLPRGSLADWEVLKAAYSYYPEEKKEEGE